MRSLARLCLLVATILLLARAQAHQFSPSYLILELTNGQLAGRWEIAIKDLLHAQGEAAFEAAMTNTEPSDPQEEMEKADAFSQLKIKVDGGPVEIRPVDYSTELFPDGMFAVALFEAAIPTNAANLTVGYRLFFERDVSHRGLMKLLIGDKTTSTVFEPANAEQTFVLREAPTPRSDEKEVQSLSPFARTIRTIPGFIRLGVHHIWTGFDHLLFLLALLFPAVLRWKKGEWQISMSFRASFINVAKVVTAFTVAHSVTLSLAALDVVHLNSRFVETTIAVSIMFAAMNNIFAVMPDLNWLVAFCFGLVHGFGFASVLGQLGLQQGNVVAPLVGFNVGVELGQLVIVGAFLPVAFRLRATRLYRIGVLRLTSLLIVALAGVWAWERIFERKILPF